MIKKSIQPINNEPALYIKNKKILVIADLHIGIEEELKEYGIHSGSQTEKLLKKIESICKKYKPKEIILLGDIKHNIPTSTYMERKDVKTFLNKIKSFAKIHIIPGNHDGNIDKIITNDIKLHPSSGFLIDNIGFIHGHRWPKKEIFESKKIIMGHTHPTIMLKDRMKFKTYEPCWVKTKFFESKVKKRYSIKNIPDLLIIPPFNPLCGGISVNKEGIVGPMKNIADIKNSEIFLLDGTYLGKACDI